MAEKLGNGGNGPEQYDLKTGRYISGNGGVKEMNLKITGKGDLESASQKIIDANKEKIIYRLNDIYGYEDVTDIKPNPRMTRKEKLDDSHGIDYYLITKSDSLGLDDKTGVNTQNFSFEIFKSVNGTNVTAWFTNKFKTNDLLSFGNLIADEESNVTGCEYDFFDMSCLAGYVYDCIGLTDPEIDPDHFLYNTGRKLAGTAKFKNTNEIKFNYRKNGKLVEGVYVRIKNKLNDKRGPTISVSLEIEKNKIRDMCEGDEHVFMKL